MLPTTFLRGPETTVKQRSPMMVNIPYLSFACSQVFYKTIQTCSGEKMVTNLMGTIPKKHQLNKSNRTCPQPVGGQTSFENKDFSHSF